MLKVIHHHWDLCLQTFADFAFHAWIVYGYLWGGGEMDWNHPRTISPRSSENSEGVKWVLQQETGCLFSKQHLITLPVSLLLLSLSFFPPQLFHTLSILLLSLNPQILQFSCKGSVSYKLFFFACWVSSSIEKHWIQASQLHWCHMILRNLCIFSQI